MKVRLLDISTYEGCDFFSKVGDIVEAVDCDGIGYNCFCKYVDTEGHLFFPYHKVEVINETQKDEHYNNDNGSLYLFAQQHELNAWEFDILKRIVRCRKKGQFKEDLEKTKRVIDLYIKEFEA